MSRMVPGGRTPCYNAKAPSGQLPQNPQAEPFNPENAGLVLSRLPRFFELSDCGTPGM